MSASIVMPSVERRGQGCRSRAETDLVLRGNTFVVETSQEFRALGGACSDVGRWKNNQTGRVWQRVKLPHSVIIDAPALADGWEGTLIRFTDRLTPDHYIAILWIVARLADPITGERGGGLIDLCDVCRAIFPRWGRGRAQDAAMRLIVWEAVQFAAAARVRGYRSYPIYVRPAEGRRKPQLVETFIDAPLWMLGQRENPLLRSLFGEPTEIPLRVEIVLSAPWLTLLRDRKQHQYIACGERLGHISPGKPAGALARSIGLALFDLWRRDYERCPDSFTVPRAEFWTKYPPAIGNPDEHLGGANPGRAADLWRSALDLLADTKVGLIDADTARTLGTKPKWRRGAGDSEGWRNMPIRIQPAHDLQGLIWPERGH